MTEAVERAPSGIKISMRRIQAKNISSCVVLDSYFLMLCGIVIVACITCLMQYSLLMVNFERISLVKDEIDVEEKLKVENMHFK